MSATRNGNIGPHGHPYGNGPSQVNNASGNIYATQGGGNITINTPAPSKRGVRTDTRLLLVTLLADVVLFFYGLLAYTGRNTSGDDWRAGLFLVMFLATAAMTGRWIRRRI